MKLQSAEFRIFTCHGYPNFEFILDCGWTEIFETSSLLCPSDHHTITHFTTTSFVEMNLCFDSLPLWKLISSRWISYSASLTTSVPQATYKVCGCPYSLHYSLLVWVAECKNVQILFVLWTKVSLFGKPQQPHTLCTYRWSIDSNYPNVLWCRKEMPICFPVYMSLKHLTFTFHFQKRPFLRVCSTLSCKSHSLWKTLPKHNLWTLKHYGTPVCPAPTSCSEDTNYSYRFFTVV